MKRELWTQPIETLAPAICTGKVSPVALVESFLDRIERLDGSLNSFIHVS
jgi:Asp-tRNA(Asn)/Glu-tRNA(Gln) amidotransferase A subunit family amidase